jgi:hypothetical protein
MSLRMSCVRLRASEGQTQPCSSCSAASNYINWGVSHVDMFAHNMSDIACQDKSRQPKATKIVLNLTCSFGAHQHLSTLVRRNSELPFSS